MPTNIAAKNAMKTQTGCEDGDPGYVDDGEDEEDERYRELDTRNRGIRKLESAQYTEIPVNRMEIRMLRTREGVIGSEELSRSGWAFSDIGSFEEREGGGNMGSGRRYCSWGGWRRALYAFSSARASSRAFKARYSALWTERKTSY